MQVLWSMIFSEVVMMLDHTLPALQQAREQRCHFRMTSQCRIVDVPNSRARPVLRGIETGIEMQFVRAVGRVIQGGNSCMTFTEIGGLRTQHSVTPAELGKGATLLSQHLCHPTTAQVVVDKEVVMDVRANVAQEFFR